MKASSAEKYLIHINILKIFERWNAFIAENMKGLGWFSYSMPKDRSSLRFKDAAASVTGIQVRPGTYEIRLPTVQARFDRMRGFTTAWTPQWRRPLSQVT